ncbi:MAG: glycosyltransferase [Clostridia bacterium]|nr:glycosyltransferase [Clostridia bacterium]
MNLLFVTFWNFDDAATNGIAKKILAQKAAFEQLGFAVDLTYAKAGQFCLERAGKPIPLCKTQRFTTRIAGARALAAFLKKDGLAYGGCYLRYAQGDWGLLKLAKTLKAKQIPLLIEIPTYPYDEENKSGLLACSLAIDKAYRNRIGRYVERYITFSEAKTIFSRPTIRTANGVDVEKSPLKQPWNAAPNGPLHLAAVAAFAPRHGYDRLISGLGEYRKMGGMANFHLDLVGDGPVMAEYRRLVERYGIADAVTFHGFLGGEALNEIYDRACLGVASLGTHRVGQSYSTSLKFFEYLVRGLPTVTTGRRERYPSLSPYVLQVPGDESPLDFFAMEAFLTKLYGSCTDPGALPERIRAIAAPLCDMAATLTPVAAYFRKEETL